LPPCSTLHTLNMASRISTMVSAPDPTNQSNHPPTPPSGVLMTGVTQSPSRDGVTSRIVGRKTGSATDLRRKTRIATWNVMSLAGTGYQVAIAREVARLNLGITGITEARIPGSDCRRVEDVLMLHSGGEQHINGVAMLLRPPFDKALISWQPISDRLLTATFAHRHGRLTVIVAYAPTEPAEDHTKERFYDQLSAVTQSVPPHNILVVLGDFNAVSGNLISNCGIVGPFGSGSPNDNSDRLLTYCGMHDLTILGSWFRRLDIHRWTWLSHDGVTRKEIDHVLTRQRDRGLFKSCRTYRGAEAPANTDHVLLASDMRLTLQKARGRKPGCPTPFDTARLIQDTDLQQQYSVMVENKFDCLGTLPDDVDSSWDSFCSIIQSSADAVIGPKKNIRKPWLSSETFDVIERKAEARRQNNNAERKRLHGIFKAKAKADREAYLKRITDEVMLERC